MKKILTLSMLFIGIAASAQNAKLEVNLQKDSTYSLTISADMDIDQLINGAHQIVKTTITGKTAHKVIAINDTLYTMQVAYKSLGMHVEIADKVMDFNTDSQKDDIMSKMLSSMVDKNFIMTMSKRGQIVAIRNIDSLFAGMVKDFPQLDEAKRAQMMAQMKQSFGEKSIKGNLQEAFVIFPKAPIAVKGTWSNINATEAAAISIKTTTAYTLTAITDKYYEVAGTATISPDKLAHFKQSGSYFIRLTQVHGDYTAQIKIDKATGWVTESHVTKNIAATAEVKRTATGPVELTYPMKITAKINGGNN